MSSNHATKQRFYRPVLESLEERLTPVTSETTILSYYFVLLARQPDAGAAGFISALNSGVRAVDVAYAIETAPGNEYYFRLVQSYYVRFLNRVPGVAETAGYFNGLAAGTRDQEVQASILASEEYYNRVGRDNTAWLNSLYQGLLGRPNLEGAFTAEQMDFAFVRESVALDILTSQEFSTKQVRDFYLRYLFRSGVGDAGADSYADQLYRGLLTNEQIIAELLGSAEYLAILTFQENRAGGPSNIALSIVPPETEESPLEPPLQSALSMATNEKPAESNSSAEANPFIENPSGLTDKSMTDGSNQQDNSTVGLRRPLMSRLLQDRQPSDFFAGS
jgi:hypothetical protein